MRGLRRTKSAIWLLFGAMAAMLVVTACGAAEPEVVTVVETVVVTEEVQVQRFAGLEAMWPKLKRCIAASWMKQRLLRQALWPKAFYGVSICTLGWTHIKGLRTEAMKALGFQMAGASPGLRLSLLCHEQCDPGFYQVWAVFTTFRRIAATRPFFVNVWQRYMENYEGQSKQGPFAKLLETCHYLRWTVEVPRLADAHGVWHDWLEMNEKTLYDLVKDASMWKVYLEVSHRKDLEGLQGIDHRVVMQARNKIKPHGLSSIFSFARWHLCGALPTRQV